MERVESVLGNVLRPWKGHQQNTVGHELRDTKRASCPLFKYELSKPAKAIPGKIKIQVAQLFGSSKHLGEIFRTMIKEPRHGGLCPQIESFMTVKNGDKKTLFQNEECSLCKEHNPSKNNVGVINWPKLAYPHPKDPKCLGFCEGEL